MANQEQFVSKPPDYKVSALSKTTEQRGPVGVAWTQPDGTIRIKLNSFVVLDNRDDLLITLFPNNQDTGGFSDHEANKGRKSNKGSNPGDPVPF